ncbi:hypothetical protein Goshw_005957 [Gossypium schwendimanii]|uniref:Uncharacterized protein n=1 Tax=Gossypium schwendimanii TaxID=34291 RepID=A0A7J9LKQ8_GOSSC|nr:hypothetical protein [Gossypium schwendimanii]
MMSILVQTGLKNVVTEGRPHPPCGKCYKLFM